MIGVLSGQAQGNPPPFTLPNDPQHEESTWIHTGYGYTNQVVHPDVLYFPLGWGNVAGAKYRYWLGVTGYQGGDAHYEQPCILVSNSLNDDIWREPAGNAYGTNPIADRPAGSYLSDIDLVYNDDTDEIWAYFREHGGGSDIIHLHKTSDGVIWQEVSSSVLVDAPNMLLSPAVVKEGEDWWMWVIEKNDQQDPVNHMMRYHSTDGIAFSFDHDCGHAFKTGKQSVTGQPMEPWHIDVVSYGGEHWGLLVECENGSGGRYSRLAFIRSTDGKTWQGYDDYVLDTGTGWDNSYIYRSTMIVEDGLMRVLYNAMSSGYTWYAGYSLADEVGGAGSSSNVIVTGDSPALCQEDSCVPVQAAYISHFTGPDCNGEEYYYTHYYGSDGVKRSWDGGGLAGTQLRSVTAQSWQNASGCHRNAWPQGNTLDGFVRIYRSCGEQVCQPVEERYISHYTGTRCDGAEYYYTGYYGFDGVLRSWDGKGLAGTVLRKVTTRSWRDWEGRCHVNEWPNGNTLHDFVRVYRPNSGVIP
jgi:hypothetical protein